MNTRREIPFLTIVAGLAIAILAMSIFVRLIADGKTLNLDQRVLQAFRNPENPKDAWGPQWFEKGVKDLTMLGGRTFLCVAVAGFCGFLILRREYLDVVVLLVVGAGSMATDKGLKIFFARSRPDVVPHLDFVNSPSLPSGHALLTMAIYGTMGLLAARKTSDRNLKIYFMVFGLGTAFVVGMTRLYLGVHYPTDVLAGWAFGLAWVLGATAYTGRKQ